MGSVCASTMSLLNAGVPLMAPFSGIAMGLISDTVFFFFNYTAPTEIYTLSLHDALPIYRASRFLTNSNPDSFFKEMSMSATSGRAARSEEHTSELQSHRELVCRLLL